MVVLAMSEFIWCHGTSCHKSHTQDRIRGSKGSKVLRTRKIKQHTNRDWYEPNQVFNHFCSQTCLYDYIRTHIQRIVALDPRTEPQETPINDPIKDNSSYYGGWVIKERVDTSTE
jgi:hypothetical protein